MLLSKQLLINVLLMHAAGLMMLGRSVLFSVTCETQGRSHAPCDPHVIRPACIIKHVESLPASLPWNFVIGGWTVLKLSTWEL